jgi:deazaflavin-dependent oxidoreductase (nitroreductase family)
MAETFHQTFMSRAFAALLRVLLRLGIGPKPLYLLTVAGRRSGRPHTTPVSPQRTERGRWLVAPFGAVGWVRNARAAGQVTLRRGQNVETLRVAEAGPAEAAPVLRQYLIDNPTKHVRPYFDVTPESPLEAIVAEAPRHPVFKLLGPAQG